MNRWGIGDCPSCSGNFMKGHDTVPRPGNRSSSISLLTGTPLENSVLTIPLVMIEWVAQLQK